MTGSGGDLRTWRSLVLLVSALLGLKEGQGTPDPPSPFSAPNPVKNLSVEAQTTSSVTLCWDVLEGLNVQNYTRWVRWNGQDDKSGTQNMTDTCFMADGLDSGSSYDFSVWVEESGVNSSEVPLNAATAPNPIRKLRAEVLTNSSITLHWEVPDGPNPHNYTYWVQWTGDGDKTETQNTTIISYAVEGLKSVSSYEFSVWVKKDGIPGSRETLESFIAPNPIRNLSVEAETSSSISLHWEAPKGPDLQNCTYWVQWTGAGNKTETQNTTNTSVTVEGLEHGTLYKCSVWAEENRVFGSRQNLSISTVPKAVTSLRIQHQTNSSITLSWTAPLGPSALPYTYWISWVDQGSTTTGTLNTPDTGIMLRELEAGSQYTFTIQAERNRASSDNGTLTGATAPSEVTNLQKETQINDSITLRWEAPADPYSHLYVYWVQWASGGQPQKKQASQRYQTSQTGTTSETFYVAEVLGPGTLYNFSVWAERKDVASSMQSLQASTDLDSVTIISCISTPGGYGVILTWSCPKWGYEAFELQVGRQRGSWDGPSCGTGVSVSGLQPAQSYSTTVTTVWDTMRAPSASVTCHTESAGVIAGAIVGVLLFLILMGLLTFFLRKKYKESQKKSAPGDMVFSFPGDIPADDFADHVRRNEKDSNCGFAEEYQHLALGAHSQSQMVASASENSAKNRYRNVLPYDWSHVPLKSLHGEPGSNYINASFVPGLWSPQEFIAAQGPLPQMVGDFWHLVWEQQSHSLVMLTNCVELGRVKCEYYRPLDAQPCTHRHLQVTLEGEQVMEDWTVRDPKLWHTHEQRILHVRQFHSVAWPDYGMPHSPDPLLAFWKVLRQWLDRTPRGGPPSVHCSSGVGRTGTFIALDVLLWQLENEGLMGPFSYVRKMWESRPMMVQTEAQYVFLHQCILRFLQSQSSLAPAEKGATYENLLFVNEAAIQAHQGKLSLGC
ncbi:LOW QUALITY PROTEIN: receptor-type tyrosine-protein phosphatase H [Pteropus medius]|uniref:LOW QUALITY PROTEIN: receptor-type tyrosine-protein phosphatase H n=1 Tax=Pteropus vampyrus TaxID=132908 RepID=UPI00196B9156|nr:LOW QUALITY PROTEIN: receptor-type tyrosine-protein phosphatase H [Pteropus giganteus]